MLAKILELLYLVEEECLLLVRSIDACDVPLAALTACYDDALTGIA